MKEPVSHTLFAKHLRELRLKFKTEYLFDLYGERRWRADFYFMTGEKVGDYEHYLIEIEGAVWSAGRHNRGKGFLADMEKYNTATMQGFKVLRFSTQQVMSGEAKSFLERWLK